MVKIDESGISNFMKTRWKEFQDGTKELGEDIQEAFNDAGESIQEQVEKLKDKFDSDDDNEENSDDDEVSDTGTIKDGDEEDRPRQYEPIAGTSAIEEPRQDYMISEDDPTYRDFFVPVGEGTTSQTFIRPERPPFVQPQVATLPPVVTAPVVVSPQADAPNVVAPRMLAPTVGAPQYPVIVAPAQAANIPVQGNPQGMSYPILVPYPAGQQPYPNQPIAVAYAAPPQQPPQQIAQPQPQKGNKSFGGFFFGKNKNKNSPQSQQQEPQAPMPAPVAVVVPPGPLPPRQVSNPQQSLPRPQVSKSPQTLVYDPKSSVRRPTSGEQDPAPGCVIHLPGSSYPPPGRNKGSHPPPVPAPDYPQEGANHPPGGISSPRPAPVQQSLPVAATRSVFRPPPGAPAETRDGACTPMSVTSATSQMSTMGQFGFGVGYLDIIPSPLNDKFDVLMQHANEWLQGSKCFKPVGFETLKLPCDEEGQVMTENPLTEVGTDSQYCSVLRMWVIPKSEEDEQEAQKVSYMCLFPKWAPELSKSKKPAMPTPETLDDTISRFNIEFASSKALQGKVLNMETLSHLHAYHQAGCPIHLDPEACAWTEMYKEDVNLLCMVRVYYIEDITATPEVVGVQDFVPECTKGRDMSSLEPFKLLVQEADKWVKKYPGLRVTNMQTVSRVSEDADDHLNTRKMMYRRRSQNPLRCSRFLRVYYTQRVDNSPEGPLVEGPSSLSYKDFVPLTEMPSRGGKKGKNKMKIHKVEKTGDVMQKVVAWHCLSGQKVVSVETVPVMGRGKLTFDPEDNYSSETSKDGSVHQLMCFRVYTDAAVMPAAAADDNRAADSDDGGPSPSGSIRSYDFAAWPHQNLPTSAYTSGNEG